IFQLQLSSEQLSEVVIEASQILQSDQLLSTRSSVLTLSEKEINAIPVLGGEADLIKTIQLLPGVSKGIEGTTDLFVRGGAADQNLVLLDGAPVYNTGHLFGFLSVFNPDILEGVESINGAFPANYGGRLSSILNVTTKSRFADKTMVSGNIGLLASRLMIRQPILKDKMEVWVAGRRTYIDQVVKAVGESLPYFFYDLNTKVIYQPTKKDRLEFTHYGGE
ncbi:MAG: TonB-dependent receptor plug domain-containing protein, partial [Flammeovirgaceae bacterium]